MKYELAILLVVLSSLLASWSQLMLKKSAAKKHTNALKEYLNTNVITSYVILMATTLINMQAMVVLPYKIVPITGTVSYVFVIFLSKLVLKENIQPKKWVGMAVIVLGIILFNL